MKTCHAGETLAILKGKFALEILIAIFQGENHFGKLLRTIPELNSRILAQRLHEFEAEGILERQVLVAEAPQSVEYELTEKALLLRKIIQEMSDFAEL